MIQPTIEENEDDDLEHNDKKLKEVRDKNTHVQLLSRYHRRRGDSHSPEYNNKSGKIRFDSSHRYPSLATTYPTPMNDVYLKKEKSNKIGKNKHKFHNMAGSKEDEGNNRLMRRQRSRTPPSSPSNSSGSYDSSSSSSDDSYLNGNSDDSSDWDKSRKHSGSKSGNTRLSRKNKHIRRITNGYLPHLPPLQISDYEWKGDTGLLSYFLKLFYTNFCCYGNFQVIAFLHACILEEYLPEIEQCFMLKAALHSLSKWLLTRKFTRRR